jgi:hypothetical protein
LIEVEALIAAEAVQVGAEVLSHSNSGAPAHAALLRLILAALLRPSKLAH